MARAIVECVPNFSEGRDPRIVDAIVNAIAATPGVAVLGYESDPDHNRSVVTFAGAPQSVARAAFRGIEKAVERIDVSSHSGVHPRVGAADVVPLIPVEGITLGECVTLAHELGEEVWSRLKTPVYLYEAAARIADRRRLENVRRGGLEWLRVNIAERPPDIGDARLHATAGAVVIGARKFLIAFNINLATADVTIARSIARAVRESGGGLLALKAIGVELESRGLAQVAMNLTDFEITGIGQAFAAVQDQAARHDVQIAGSEIIGLIPRRAWNQAAAVLLKSENFSPQRIFEDRLEAVSPRGTLADLLDRIADPASPMGGGSAAAVSGAVSAALGCMTARLSHLPHKPFEAHREYFAAAVERDAAAFGEVQRSGRSQDALLAAALVPAEISERARELDRDLLNLKEQAPEKLHSDLITALALARAARAGGISTVRANLPLIENSEIRLQLKQRLTRKVADRE